MDAYINSSRAGHGAPNLLEAREGGPEEDSRRSSILSNDARGDLPYNQSEPQSSIVTSRDGNSGPPKVYEELIQGLEGEVRKHIRIEQQLKLHIETIEGRLDELEAENEKLAGECQKLEQTTNEAEWRGQQEREDFENKLRAEIQGVEDKHKQELRSQ
jgi:hypothetical protein